MYASSYWIMALQSIQALTLGWPKRARHLQQPHLRRLTRSTLFIRAERQARQRASSIRTPCAGTRWRVVSNPFIVVTPVRWSPRPYIPTRRSLCSCRPCAMADLRGSWINSMSPAILTMHRPTGQRIPCWCPSNINASWRMMVLHNTIFRISSSNFAPARHSRRS